MEEVLLFIEENQTWIFLVLVIIGVIYLRSTIFAFQEMRRAIYRLERERSVARLTRSGASLALVAAVMLATFIIVTFTTPALPASARPTPIPTVSFLTTPNQEGGGEVDGLATATSISSGVGDSSGCINPLATILSPADNDSVSGVVTFTGAANIPGFAFYKIEYNDLSSTGSWLAISANTTQVCEDTCEEEEVLANWDTSLVTPGDYAVRLVVTDTAGNAPLPCQILLRVIP
jgi:hypothetical protein